MTTGIKRGFAAALALAAICIFGTSAAFAAASTQSAADAAAQAAAPSQALVATKVVRGPRGRRGPRGLRGLRGPAGPQGPQGPQGAPGITNVPAAGDLVGTFPAPQIAPGHVGLAHLAFDPATQVELDAFKALLAGAGALNAAGNPIAWTKLKGVPAGFADGNDDVGIDFAPASPQRYTFDIPHQSDPLLWLRANPPTATTYDSQFRFDKSGGLLATGQLGLGTIPVEGAGYRFMWYPYKGAFRAGYGNGGTAGGPGSWDDANTGFFSWSGGSDSTAKGLYSFAFGDTNLAESTSSIAFGSGNTVNGAAGFSAGAGNKARDTYSVALGNKANAGQGADPFGRTGLASIALGMNVGALGDNDVALGYKAATAACPAAGTTCDFENAATFDGSFVWGDHSTESFLSSTANNEFAIRAAGGVRLRTNPTLSTGCNLPAGSGVFSCTSDRNTKHELETVDGADVLRKIAALPITTWSFKTEKSGARHLGPMAQDFYRAFHLGTSSRSIGLTDLNGVNLAGVKALYQRSEQQEEQLELQARQIGLLQKQVAALSKR
jgi:hypothetical protein